LKKNFTVLCEILDVQTLKKPIKTDVLF